MKRWTSYHSKGKNQRKELTDVESLSSHLCRDFRLQNGRTGDACSLVGGLGLELFLLLDRKSVV